MITEIFCAIDDAIPEIEANLRARGDKLVVATRGPKSTLCASEVMTIGVLFHFSHYRNFKRFYCGHVQTELRSAFPRLPSYSQFNKLYGRLPSYTFLVALMLASRFRGRGVYAIDPTPLPVCHIKREYSHKVMQSVAMKSKSTMGWYYGLKLHLVVNSDGEIASFLPTSANCDERQPEVVEALTSGLSGYLLGDKAYISTALTGELLNKGLRLVTPARKNMKTTLLPDAESVLLRGRQVVESCFHVLKNILHIQHTRHRSVLAYFVNLFTGLIAYAFYPHKPKSRIRVVEPSIHETLQMTG